MPIRLCHGPRKLVCGPGLEPGELFGLNEATLPDLPSRTWYPGWGSNPHTPDSHSDRFAKFAYPDMVEKEGVEPSGTGTAIGFTGRARCQLRAYFSRIQLSKIIFLAEGAGFEPAEV